MTKLFTRIADSRFLKWLRSRNWHKHPLVIPVGSGLLLFFVGLALFVMNNGQRVTASDSHLIVVSYDKKQETVPTRAKTVGEFLERAQITLNEGDVVEPNKDTEIIDDKFRVNVYRARPVVVVDGGRKTFALSAATTPRSVATQVGIKVYPEDKIESKMETDFIKDNSLGERLVIERATLTNLNLYGAHIPVRTHAKTVGELLQEKGINITKTDQVRPKPESAITEGMQVFVVREGSKIEMHEEEIPMEVETIEDARLSFGAVVVRQQGNPGKRIVTYQLDFDKKGNQIGRKEIQSIVAEKAVKQIIAKGKTVYIPSDKGAIMSAAGISQSDQAYVNYIIGRESGWNAAAHNYGSGAFGLCQALPGSKMASSGADWQTNPVTQLRWCTGYAKGRYGSWSAAYNFWLSNHWW